MSNGQEISRSRLLQIHKQKLESDETKNYNTTKLVEILGGYDQILTHYLTSKNEMLLNESQLQHIYQVIACDADKYPDNEQKIELTSITPNKEQLPDSIITKMMQMTTSIARSSQIQETNKTLCYKYSKHNTYLHSMFNPQKAQRIIDFVFNMKYMVFFVVSGFIWIVWASLGTMDRAYYIYKLIFYFHLTVYFIFVLLSVNKNAMRESIKLFVFWFKLWTVVQNFTCIVMLRYVLIKDRAIGAVEILGDVFANIAVAEMVMFYSTIDGYQISRRGMILPGIGFSVILTIEAVFLTFFVDQNIYEKGTLFITEGIGVSFMSIYGNAMSILAIFTCKQTIIAIIKKDKCINLRISPYIEWID